MRSTRIAAVCLVMAAVIGTCAIVGSGVRRRTATGALATGRAATGTGDMAAPASAHEALAPPQETSNPAAGSAPRDGYFAECRMTRDRARSARQETLTRLLDTDPDASVRSQIQTELSSVAREADMEVRIEALIRARGYADAVVILSPTGASVVVATPGLDARGAGQIGEIASRVSGLPLKSVVILERPLLSGEP